MCYTRFAWSLKKEKKKESSAFEIQAALVQELGMAQFVFPSLIFKTKQTKTSEALYFISKIAKEKTTCVPRINSGVRAGRQTWCLVPWKVAGLDWGLPLKAACVCPPRTPLQTSWHSLSLDQEDRIDFPVRLIIVL